jgi:hypothetical protein
MPYWVYVIRQDGTDNVKIGFTHNTTVRVWNLQTGCPQALEVLDQLQCDSMAAAQEIEARLHQKYAEYGIGGEWFKLPDAVLADLLWWFDIASRAIRKPRHALRPLRDIPLNEPNRESAIIFQQLFGGLTEDELREQQALYEARRKAESGDK